MQITEALLARKAKLLAARFALMRASRAYIPTNLLILGVVSRGGRLRVFFLDVGIRWSVLASPAEASALKADPVFAPFALKQSDTFLAPFAALIMMMLETTFTQLFLPVKYVVKVL